MSKQYDLKRIEENFRYLVINSYRAIFNIHGRYYEDEPQFIKTEVFKIDFKSPLKSKVETRTKKQQEASNQIPTEKNQQKATVERLPEVEILDIDEPKQNDILSKDGKTAKPGDYIYDTNDKEYVKWDPDSIFNESDKYGNPIPPFPYIIKRSPSNK